MESKLLGIIALALLLGIGMQWLAWRLKLPSILLLLLAGLGAGPVAGWMNPDQLLGEFLMPFVSVSVALILFEGGLTLKVGEWRQIGGVVRNLITFGALITWGLASWAAWLCLGWSLSLCLLLGAILVVTGPTVIMPLLRHVQPTRQVGSILKWEGILIDPVGALLAVLVYEAIRVNLVWHDFPMRALGGFGLTLLVGGVLGLAGAWILVEAFRRYWVPDFLQNPFSLMWVVSLFVGSNLIQHESGLLTVTIMGIALANQKHIPIRHIVEFKENLRVLLLSLLFILLAARVQRSELLAISWGSSAAFLAILILGVRPVATMLSTIGSPLKWRERAFIAWMAPRGIVAAAIGSMFALKLQQAGHEEAGMLVPVLFFVIVGTVLIYGLTSLPLSKWLGVSRPNPQGVLIVGAHSLGRAIGGALQRLEFDVLLVDFNRENVAKAKMEELRANQDNILREHIGDELDLEGIGKLLALTPNREVNALAALHFAEFFGRQGVYQLPSARESRSTDRSVTHELKGRTLFGEGMTYEELQRRLRDGASVKATPLTEEFDYDAFCERHGDRAIPLFLVTEKRELRVFEKDHSPEARPGNTLISLQTEEKQGEGGH